MLPIQFLFDDKNTTMLGNVLYEGDIPICISVYLDLIVLYYENSESNLIDAIAETLMHETLHELFGYEGIPDCCHHWAIDRISLYIFDDLMLNPDFLDALDRRKENIEKDISVMFV